jgi:sugar lactone lactonase YvrE
MKRNLLALVFSAVLAASPAAAQSTLYVVNSGDSTVKQVPSGGGSFTNYATGFNLPTGIAAASNGTIYVSDFSNNDIYKIAPGGGTPTIYATGFNSPAGIALDAGGNLYVADQGNSRIMKVAPGGLSATVLATGSGFTPLSVALNSTGTVLYISDLQAQEVYQVPTATPSSPYSLTPVAAVSFASGLAVAPDGTVYVGNFTLGQVRAIPPGGGTPTVYASGFSTPYGLTLDPSGNLYVSNEGNGTISRVPVGGGTPLTYVSGLDTPYFITFIPVPEPGAVLFACAAAGVCVTGWRRWRAWRITQIPFTPG